MVGVLARTNTPDDQAIFRRHQDGLGHSGHWARPRGCRYRRRCRRWARLRIANAAVVQYQRITEDNIDSFHFHGSQDDFPASAVIVVPNDTRSGTILKGRYLDSDLPTQLIEPAGVIQGLVDRIFRIKSLLDVVTAIISVAAFAAVGLAIFLSFRLRSREIATAVKLGAQKGMIFRLLAAETFLLLLTSVAIGGIGAIFVSRQADAWVTWLLAIGT